MSLDFFDDIYIASDALPEPSFFEKAEGSEAKGRWHWQYEGNRMDYDLDELLRFRVQEARAAGTCSPGVGCRETAWTATWMRSCASACRRRALLAPAPQARTSSLVTSSSPFF